jgi:hypothetical protein
MIRERWHQFLFGFYPPDQNTGGPSWPSASVRRPGAGAVLPGKSAT